jgi:hypothetical protein
VSAGHPDAVQQALAGHQAARQALADVRSGVSHPDALLARLDEILVSGSRERLRAFVRELQKILER